MTQLFLNTMPKTLKSSKMQMAHCNVQLNKLTNNTSEVINSLSKLLIMHKVTKRHESIALTQITCRIALCKKKQMKPQCSQGSLARNITFSFERHFLPIFWRIWWLHFFSSNPMCLLFYNWSNNFCPIDVKVFTLCYM